MVATFFSRTPPQATLFSHFARAARRSLRAHLPSDCLKRLYDARILFGKHRSQIQQHAAIFYARDDRWRIASQPREYLVGAELLVCNGDQKCWERRRRRSTAANDRFSMNHSCE